MRTEAAVRDVNSPPLTDLEREWRAEIRRQALPELEISEWAGRRVVVAVAHPDDEVLGTGGLLRALSLQGNEILLIWATDGEWSHPESRRVDPQWLGRARRLESRQALATLGVTAAEERHLGLPDSELVAHFDAAIAALREAVRPGDVLVSPWRCDGHPDHEAVAHACADVARQMPDVSHAEFPIWAWHWTTPELSRIPWARARSVQLPAADRARKATAIAAFVTQVRPLGDAPGDTAILPPEVLAHFARDVEVVLR